MCSCVRPTRVFWAIMRAAAEAQAPEPITATCAQAVGWGAQVSGAMAHGPIQATSPPCCHVRRYVKP